MRSKSIKITQDFINILKYISNFQLDKLKYFVQILRNLKIFYENHN